MVLLVFKLVRKAAEHYGINLNPDGERPAERSKPLEIER